MLGRWRVFGLASIVGAFGISSALSMSARADTVVVSDDATVRPSKPWGRDGDGPSLVVRANGDLHRALVRFDLRVLPPDVTVARATLRLFVGAVQSAGRVDVRALVGPWSEASVSAATQPPAAGWSVGRITVGDASSGAFVSLDVTDLVQDWVDGALANHGVALLPLDGVRVAFDAKENADTSQAPELEVVLADLGPVGPAGPVGPTGPRGAAGPEGAAGASGPPGESVTGMSLAVGDASCPYGGTMFVLGAEDYFACNGAPGARGADGAPGARGADGLPGAVGATGATGARGATGDTGPAGPPGERGPAGADGATGARGATGETGPSGPAGPEGPAGPQGPAGPEGPSGPPGTGLTWIAVTTSAPIAAAPNTGYLASASAPISVTLPEGAFAVGQTIRVAGQGLGWTQALAGGTGSGPSWAIARGARQTLLTGPTLGAFPISAVTHGVALSADGGRIVFAAERGGLGDWLYTSADAGESSVARVKWTWGGVASSGDGRTLVAFARLLNPPEDLRLYVSNDFGATWNVRLTGRNGPWNAAAISTDGSRIAVIGNRHVYTSSDRGETWVERVFSDGNGIAASADGCRIVAAAGFGAVLTSTDCGESWTEVATPFTAWPLASSADGRHLVGANVNELLWTSEDFGENWVAAAGTPSGDMVGNVWWYSVASSADGSRIAAVQRNGRLWTSDDFGATWVGHGRNQAWTTVASSSDGLVLMASSDSGLFRSEDGGATWIVVDIFGAGGGIQGDAASAVELQYLGGGAFRVLSHEGTITVF